MSTRSSTTAGKQTTHRIGVLPNCLQALGREFDDPARAVLGDGNELAVFGKPDVCDLLVDCTLDRRRLRLQFRRKFEGLDLALLEPDDLRRGLRRLEVAEDERFR